MRATLLVEVEEQGVGSKQSVSDLFAAVIERPDGSGGRQRDGKPCASDAPDLVLSPTSRHFVNQPHGTNGASHSVGGMRWQMECEAAIERGSGLHGCHSHTPLGIGSPT